MNITRYADLAFGTPVGMACNNHGDGETNTSSRQGIQHGPQTPGVQYGVRVNDHRGCFGVFKASTPSSAIRFVAIMLQATDDHCFIGMKQDRSLRIRDSKEGLPRSPHCSHRNIIIMTS